MVELPSSRLHSARQRRGSTWVTVLVVSALALFAGGVVYMAIAPKADDEAEEMLLQPASLGPFEFLVIAQGEVESSVNVEIRCEVKSRNSNGTLILDVVPEGTQVQPGKWLVKLDATALEQERRTQQIACNSAEALMIQAKNLYEAAVIAKREYEEGTFRQDEQTILSTLFVAQENLRRAQQYEIYSERLAAKGYVTSLQLEGDRFAVDKTKNELKTAETSLNVLREYTLKKMMKQFEGDIAITDAQWKSQQSSYQLELDKLQEIEDQIEKCTIVAPTAGTVVYANQFSSRGGNAEFVVEPGALVRESQVLVRLPDPEHMQVKAKINEARITLIQDKNLPVAIKVDALNDVTLNGELAKVNQYAEPRSWSSGSIREYAAFIKILDPPPTLRPGMNAEVQILVEKQLEALQIPVQSICEHKARYFCLLKRPDGFETVEVNIGSSNDKFMTIKSGIQQGDLTVMNPRGFPDLLQLPDLPDPPSVSKELPKLARAAPRGAPGGSDQAGNQKSRPSVAEMVSRTMQLDKDGDGALSAEELQEMPEDRRQRTLDADTNGDGKVERTELTVALAKARAKGGGAHGGSDNAGPPGGGPRGAGAGGGGERGAQRP